MITIKKVQVVVRKIEYSATCDNCDTPMIHDPVASKASMQFQDALVIDLNGGYGMFFDNMISGDPRLVLCEKCANKLIEQFPYFQKAIDGENMQDGEAKTRKLEEVK